ncbi:MAG: cobyrinate a,c-diamide synthase, partial [Planctomycetes bacterium]|nr:cobyrinate a,c-diamide synthase [Planctomycetota bacterium]
GVMGLYDGPGSTAEVARVLGARVVLVVDAGAMAASAAAVVRGFESLDRRIDVAAVILNRVGSEGHYRMLREAIDRHCRARVMGYLPPDSALVVPERPLGLIPAGERGGAGELARRLVGHMERTVDLEALLRMARRSAAGAARPRRRGAMRPGNSEMTRPLPWGAARERRLPGSSAAGPGILPACRIAVARDEAFCFYYEDNLDLLRSLGADLAFFSPLRDRRLPRGSGAVYFGGGFPERFEKRLRASPLAAELQRVPVYAECGGLMFLAMIGLVPGRIEMTGRLQHFGYVEAVGLGSFLVRRGERVRGHEFHFSRWTGEGRRPVWRVRQTLTGQERAEGFASDRIHASYVHVHFAACPWMAKRLVEAAKPSSSEGEERSLS